MKILVKIDTMFIKIASAITAVMLCAIILLISGNVFSRLLLQKSFIWVEEISYICFTWLVFFGASILYSKRSLITIDMVVDRLGPKAKRIVEIITNIILFIINIALTIWATQMTISTTRITSMLKISYKIVYAGIVIAFLMMTYYSVKFMVLTIMGNELQEASIEDRA